MARSLILRYTALIFSVVLVFSCSKSEQPEPTPPSTDNTLIGFRFESGSNSQLKTTVNAYFNGKTVYVTIPRGVSLTSLKPTADINAKATLRINNTVVKNGVTAFDFTNTLNAVVTSESGLTNSYKILVQNGEQSIDNIIYAFMKKYSIPGISCSISKNEQMVYSVGLGFAITESDVRVTSSHLFRLASCSKQFTTYCIMKLYEQGLLSLDAKIFGTGGILGAEYPTVSDKASRVTVKHMLSHTSGWTSDPDPMFTSSFYGKTLEQRIDYMLTSPQSEPGTVYSYYNMGFGVLGKIVEKITGKDFETYLKEQLALAGIFDVHIGKNLAGRRSNEVVYYSQSGTNGYGNEMEVIKAAGGVIASAPEMLKLAHRLDGYSTVPDFITSATRSIMITPPFPSVYTRYGLGWRVNHTYFPNAMYHTGNLAGTATMWVIGENLNVVVLCNSRSYISGFDDEMYGLLKDIRTLASSISW